MKTKKLIFIAAIATIYIFSANLSAQDDYYKMNNIKSQYYISASRNAVSNNNLSQACILARKAVQANSWSKEAWANYDDIVKKLIKEGKVKDFNMPKTLNANTPNAEVLPPASTPTPVQNNTPAPATSPSPSADAGQYEGC